METASIDAPPSPFRRSMFEQFMCSLRALPAMQDIDDRYRLALTLNSRGTWSCTISALYDWPEIRDESRVTWYDSSPEEVRCILRLVKREFPLMLIRGEQTFLTLLEVQEALRRTLS